MKKRITWHKYFMDIVELVSKRSTCLKRNVGAIAVRDNRIISTGYNGQIPGARHCDKCLRESSESGTNLDICRALHAEWNVVCQAARYGISLNDSIVYVEIKPCAICFKLLAACKVKRMIYKQDYSSKLTDKLVAESEYFYDEFIDLDDNKYYTIERL